MDILSSVECFSHKETENMIAQLSDGQYLSLLLKTKQNPQKDRK